MGEGGRGKIRKQVLIRTYSLIKGTYWRFYGVMIRSEEKLGPPL